MSRSIVILDLDLHCLKFSAVWSGSTLFAILSLIRVYTYLPFSAVRSGSPLLAILSSLIKATICHSQQSDQGLHCMTFSAVWSRSTIFTILSSLIRVYTTCHSQQSDQGQHYLPFSAIWSGCTLFATLSSLIKAEVYTVIFRNRLIRVYTIYHSKQSIQCLLCLPFTTVWSGSTLFAILSSLIKIYTVCHSQQSEQGLQYLPFQAVWSGSTLFAILSLIRFYTIFHSQQSDQGLHYMPFFLSSIIIPFQGLHYLPFSAVWSGSPHLAILSSLIKVFIICHSQQSDQGLHYMPFSAVWSRSTLFDIHSSLIKVKVYTVISRNSLIRVYTICHSKQSDVSLHCLPFSTAVWSGSTLFSIISSLIRVYTICHSQQSDQRKGLHSNSQELSD